MTSAEPTDVDYQGESFPAGTGIAGAFAGLLVGIVLSGVVGIAIVTAGGYSSGIPGGPGAALGRAVAQASVDSVDIETNPVPIAVLGLLQIPLWIGLLGAPLLISKVSRRETGDGLWQGFADDLGFRFQASDIPLGLAVGVFSQLVLLPALYWPIFKILGDRDLSGAARSLTDQASGDPLGVVVLVLMVAVGAPLVEELFFRGFLQRSLHRRFGFIPAWLIASFVFGIVHFQMLQLPALMAFGMVAGALFAKFERLGPAIWAHVGFNMVTVIALLVL